ncbi:MULTISPECIES: nucleoside-diphosphate sugar epimerase/dehydratase [Sorangium]|uniref:Polysaccharide biosynthesis protein n=1 Tax=Sorangium cellulosum TaxID=56 RepID=A0A4P2QVJ5_SORCE|nr:MULTISPECIES: nucleoside-diphosphate sugar epimerase/dehydratase [Sorangium]AUX34186.1 polysaccharide biosynthesis protein [Sorangium cellulosum]WCQ93499.1 nucleotide-sugar epimerase [Sorangium sp. Soce836]
MRRLLIVGAGEAGRVIVHEFLASATMRAKYTIAGLVDDFQKRAIRGIPVIGGIKDLGDLVARNDIDEVLIAIPSSDRKVIDRILSSLSDSPVSVKIVPGLYEIVEGHFTLRQIRDFDVVDLLGREEIGFDKEQISPCFHDKVVFVTGAGGSIGAEICRQLLELPVKKVIALGRGESSVYELIQGLGVDQRVEYIIGDVRDYTKIDRELRRCAPHIVFHAAAHKHVSFMEDHPDEALKNNVIGTFNCANIALEAGVQRFVLVSTDKAVAPTSVMGATKRLAESIVLSMASWGAGTRFSVTRFGNVLGSRGSVLPLFKRQIEAGGPVTVTHPEMTRYFMSIREAARLVIKSSSAQSGSVFVLDMGQPIKILDLARNLIQLYGRTPNAVNIVFTGVRRGEKLNERTFTDRETLEPSEFKRLFVARNDEVLMSRGEVSRMIEQIKVAADALSPDELRRLISRYVPDYVAGSSS